jgi:predicted SprT family Zn-dependent metalloprotease|tara:strand:- start:520 stop:1218 length:699 start_codon:yes stop_codon:yes gene_type:complete
MNIAEQAYNGLYPERELNHNISLKYSGKFKSYNANVRMYGRNLTFNLSKSWRKVSKEIQMGLIQSLMLKIFKDKKKTMNIDLYEIFMKKVHMSVPKTKSEPELEESFNRVNDGFFYGLIETPNLVWGNFSRSKLGSYEYGTDTISISRVFKEDRQDILDYIMYHEVLHKKHKFYTKNGRSYHHTAEFRRKEKEFPNSAGIEKSIKSLMSRRVYGSQAPKPVWNFLKKFQKVL